MSAPTQEAPAPVPPTKDLRPALSPLRRRMTGMAVLAIAALFVAICVGSYNKLFKPVDTVTLKTETAGDQMRSQADVKVRGVIVGKVRSVETYGTEATLELAMDPDTISTIPSNTTAFIVPKTLFGERYVSLSIPPNASSRPLQDGDVITEDRSANATEPEQLLNSLLPVLTAVQPQKLSATLGAFSQTLAGRGEQLGDTLVQLNQFLVGFNPSLPDLEANLRALAPTADIYNAASPDLIGALNNLVTTSRTMVEERAAFSATFRSVTSASNTTTNFLAANRDNVIELQARQRPILDLVARYSSEFPCLFRQLTDLVPKINNVLRPDTGIQIDLEINMNRGKYVPSDAPEYADSRGPRCYRFEGQAPQYPPGGPIQDGSSKPAPSRSTQDAYEQNPAPEQDQASMTGDDRPGRGGATSEQPAENPPGQDQSTSGQGAGGRIDPANIGAPNTPNSPQERRLVTEVTALQMGLPPGQVPSFAPYLTAATMRGAPVTLR